MTDVDAGYGLTLRGLWLVSWRNGRRCRWLTRWCQLLLAGIWNLVPWTLNDWRRWRYLAAVAWGALVLLAGPHLPPWGLLDGGSEP